MVAEEGKEIRASQDFDGLEETLKELVGQPCLRASLTYGGELEIHFGEAKSYRHPKLADTPRGSWVLESPGTPWAFDPTGEKGHFYLFGFPLVFPPKHEPVSDDEVQASLSGLGRTKVVAIKAAPAKGDLTIVFSNGATFFLLSKYAPLDLCIPAWELSTPHGTYYQVWSEPVPMWSLLRSDVQQAS